MKQLTLLLVLLSLVSVSCQKEDEAIVLPLPGDVLQLVAPMGSNYDDQVYVSLSKGKIHVMPYRNYDLAFEASAQGFHIYLNGAKYMFASRTTTSDFFWQTPPMPIGVLMQNNVMLTVRPLETGGCSPLRM
ncbi:MAG: hypothetical protein IPM91_04340 [Bacteroidetes bacterium]|nr:hypothetical protein [Bacteroidota bacterium]